MPNISRFYKIATPSCYQSRCCRIHWFHPYRSFKHSTWWRHT